MSVMNSKTVSFCLILPLLQRIGDKNAIHIVLTACMATDCKRLQSINFVSYSLLQKMHKQEGLGFFLFFFGRGGGVYALRQILL